MSISRTPLIAIGVKLDEQTIRALDRLAAEFREVTTRVTTRSDAIRFALTEYFAGRNAQHASTFGPAQVAPEEPSPQVRHRRRPQFTSGEQR